MRNCFVAALLAASFGLGVRCTACPTVSIFTAPEQVWTGQKFLLKASVVADEQAWLRWQRDGLDVEDGARASGASTDTLVIGPASAADTGNYRLSIDSSCGRAYSTAVAIRVKAPPATGGTISVVYLHPEWARWSQALAVKDGLQAGSIGAPPDPAFPLISYPTHAVAWAGSAASAVDINPAGSAGSVAYSASATGIAGSWNKPAAPPSTAIAEMAALWSLPELGWASLESPGGTRAALRVTGPEGHAGAVWYFDQSGLERYKATFWPAPDFQPVSLHPAGLFWSYVTGLTGANQFGWTQTSYSAAPRAAVWRGSAATLQDCNPSGASASRINGAGSGQSAGWATFAGTTKAGTWGGGPGTYVPVHPPGASYSEAAGASGGIQAGHQVTEGRTRACLWAGSALSVVDLHGALTAGFADSMARGVDVDEYGVIRVVGSGQNRPKARHEALLWRIDPPLGGRYVNVQCKDASAQVIQSASSRFRFRLTGRVVSVETSGFRISDPSGSLRVALPEHGLHQGQLVAACGAIDLFSGEPVMAAEVVEVL